MRIIEEISFPGCKVSILAMNQKFILKFEKGNLEQTYKVAEIDLIFGLDDVKKLLNEEFLTQVMNRFKQMDNDFDEQLAQL
ncbi:hypothetical protein NF867_13250 [Solitalea sp. MAHUQ-68]|uniref:Uncharacterized protein n=1 Tax=Solitalea agri TaxID=2953739 RepID=A0A9X2JFV6_9SPHI|nr:hypothetical protein [Solitalea agri]MCO4293831.1 hypothetical protein [Solitalea agri]